MITVLSLEGGIALWLYAYLYKRWKKITTFFYNECCHLARIFLEGEASVRKSRDGDTDIQTSKLAGEKYSDVAKS